MEGWHCRSCRFKWQYWDEAADCREIYFRFIDQSRLIIFRLSHAYPRGLSFNPRNKSFPFRQIQIPSHRHPIKLVMSVEISLITPQDIPYAITTIQSAFTDDPFNYFIYDQASLSLARNAASLGIRLRWGIANGHVLVAHTPERRCAGVAMWVPPKPLTEPQTWWEWGQSWWLWIQQVRMNLWYGRGGLRVDACSSDDFG